METNDMCATLGTMDPSLGIQTFVETCDVIGGMGMMSLPVFPQMFVYQDWSQDTIKKLKHTTFLFELLFSREYRHGKCSLRRKFKFKRH